MNSRNDKLIRELTWDLVAINVHLEDIRRIWAEALGINGPQWLIMMAISDLDGGRGVSVGEVSAKLHVHQTFVSAQTRDLEKSGFLNRSASPDDARIVAMSLTDKARKEIGKLSARRNQLNEFMFADIGNRTLEEITRTLGLIRRRSEKAALQLDLDNSKLDE
jgi:MarR family transcriptional regulator, organic hydroperoxide resistance regulator